MSCEEENTRLQSMIKTLEYSLRCVSEEDTE